MNGIKNPEITYDSTTPVCSVNPIELTTNIFYAKTYYDGKLLDETSVTDITKVLKFQPLPDSISVESFDFGPENMGESAAYAFTLKPSKDIPVGGSIEMEFETGNQNEDGYHNTLCSPDK